MLVTDARFGAQVVTRTGKTLTFDSIDCMRKRLETMARADVREIWVVDARHPGKLVRFEEASVVESGELHPPMGMAYANAR
jgi:copper chaperone NosL